MYPRANYIHKIKRRKKNFRKYHVRVDEKEITMICLLEISKKNNKNETMKLLNEIMKLVKKSNLSILNGNDKDTLKIVKE